MFLNIATIRVKNFIHDSYFMDKVYDLVIQGGD